MSRKEYKAQHEMCWAIFISCGIILGKDAVVAQLAEQLIRNEQVAGSIPVNGSIFLVRFLFENSAESVAWRWGGI